MKMCKDVNRYFIIIGLLFLLACNFEKPEKSQQTTKPVIERVEFKDKYGNRHYQGLLVNGKKEGLWITYDASTYQVQEIQNFVNGIKDGTYISFNPDKTVEWLGNYKSGQKEGHWIGFQKDNILRSDSYVFDDYTASTGRQYDDNGFLFEEYDYKTRQVIQKFEITKLDKYMGWTTQ